MGTQRLAAADPTPERPEVPDTLAESSHGTPPGDIQDVQCDPLTGSASDDDRHAVQSDSHRAALGQQHRRPELKALPPRPNRRVRYIEPLRNGPQAQPAHQLERQPAPDDLHGVESPPQHQIWQKRVRPPTRGTPTTPNPDAFHQEWRAQPAPVTTPADQPPPTDRTSLWRHGHLLAGRHVTRRRRWIRPYDGHWGCLPTLSPNPPGCTTTGRVLLLGISRRLLCRPDPSGRPPL